YRLQSTLAVPLMGRDGIAGVLSLYHPDRDAFSREDLRLVDAASGAIGLALESATKFENAESLARIDHLTGIPNVRARGRHLDRELERAARSEERRVGKECRYGW